MNSYCDIKYQIIGWVNITVSYCYFNENDAPLKMNSYCDITSILL